jgi:hypothetical protein
MAATDTKAAIRPYSMAVAPLSSLAKRMNLAIMKLTPFVRLGLGDSRFWEKSLDCLLKPKELFD